MAMGEPGDCLEVLPDPVRQPVPRRREGADGQARRPVRHAAPAARGSRQRRLPPVLPDAQPRPAPGLRPRAGQVAQQRQPGVLHPVRARARRQRDEAAGRARPAVRSAQRHWRASRGSTVRRSRPCSLRWRAIPEVVAAGGAATARRTRWCTTCASSRTAFHTWYNAAPFIVEDAALRNARLALALGVQQVVRNGLGAARRIRAGEHVSQAPPDTARDYKGAQRSGLDFGRWREFGVGLGAGLLVALVDLHQRSSRRRPTSDRRRAQASARAQRRATPSRRHRGRIDGADDDADYSTSTSCCRSSRSWCRRRNASARVDAAARDRPARHVFPAGGLLPRLGRGRARARAARAPGHQRQRAARRRRRRCLAPRAHRPDQGSGAAESAARSSCRRRTSTRW